MQARCWSDRHPKHALIRRSHGLKQSGEEFNKLRKQGQNRRAGLALPHRVWPHAIPSPLLACQENSGDLKGLIGPTPYKCPIKCLFSMMLTRRCWVNTGLVRRWVIVM